MAEKKIETLDSTLRDGAQGEGISFSIQDKIHIVQALDELGITFIEAGNPSSNPKDLEFFQEVKKLQLRHAHLCAFGSTRRKDVTCENDMNVQSLLQAGTNDIVLFGKSWDFQAKEILKTSLDENLAMIFDTCKFFSAHGKNVLFDAEHFFTGYKANPIYALQALEAALQGGASVLVLCETKGGSLPNECFDAVKGAFKKFGSSAKIGIHTHNDAGLAIANSLAAVDAGASHVQGTFLGFGERSGNANLSATIANLELKMNCTCLPNGNLQKLTSIAKRIAEIANISLNPQLPYVGHHAFAHKAGMHIDAVIKNPEAYEHVSPDAVGNSRVFLMSEVAGRSMIIEKIKKFHLDISKDDEVVKKIIDKVKSLEYEGYQFEGADGSFELLVRKTLHHYKPFFQLHYYQTNGINPRPETGVNACAQLKLEVDGQIAVSAGEGDGPVNALDIALRAALEKFYPAVNSVRLTDYKVRVLDGKSATASRVRVLIESTDGSDEWTTIGVSADIMEASYLALVDSIEYKLIKDIEKHFHVV